MPRSATRWRVSAAATAAQVAEPTWGRPPRSHACARHRELGCRASHALMELWCLVTWHHAAHQSGEAFFDSWVQGTCPALGELVRGVCVGAGCATCRPCCCQGCCQREMCSAPPPRTAASARPEHALGHCSAARLPCCRCGEVWRARPQPALCCQALDLSRSCGLHAWKSCCHMAGKCAIALRRARPLFLPGSS